MTSATPGLNRTYDPKWVTYTGDGNGRDQYITFCNGGLNELRRYNGPNKDSNGFKQVPRSGIHTPVIPRKEATAFDYPPDGSGRDSYIIFNHGLKANYRSKHREFEKDLRSV